MALKHGCAAPTGITLTGTLIHKVTKREVAVGLEGFTEAGAFSLGKVIRSRVDYDISGECLSTLSLPAKGSGAYTSASPFIDETTIEDNHEGISTFSVKAHYYETVA